jgi:mercuric ion transport protein
LLLAGSGLAAAFAAASCCGVPLLLGTVGLGSGWLVAVAWLAAPHRIALLVAAAALLAGGAGTFVLRRRVGICPPRRGTRAAGALLTAIPLAGVVLTVLGYLYT